ncbi:recombination endonuclease VII [Actinocatenispora sera]|uniref:Recombination endonuclease VII n=2 Tax=Actinocatenispora sera TaxID=390989 RepID=A0A810L7B5_9ACTN|nr:recombination endonuclease VII [Actinocatenispora sera]
MEKSDIESKFCKDCKRTHPISEFHRNSRSRDGYAFYCKSCANLRQEASRRRRGTNPRKRPSQAIPAGMKWCPDCAEIKQVTEFPTAGRRRKVHTYCRTCHNKRGRESKQRLYGGSREYHLRRRYGIGVADFERMLAEQGGVCAICGRAAPEHVDHDHVSGGVRGILCFNCNGGLGHFRDDVEHLAKAISYLRGTTPWVEISPGVYRSNSRTPAVRRSRII